MKDSKLIVCMLLFVSLLLLLIYKGASLELITSRNYSSQTMFWTVSNGKFVLYATRLDEKGKGNDPIQ
jgi:hypothetical protein